MNETKKILSNVVALLVMSTQLDNAYELYAPTTTVRLNFPELSTVS